MKNKAEIRLKDGTVFPIGTDFSVSFVGGGSVIAVLVATISGKQFKTNCVRLPRYFDGFRVPSTAALEKAIDEGICRSVMGERVEPDGWDQHGSPSWLLALGMI